MSDSNLEAISIQLIVNAGEAKTLCLEALKLYKENNYDLARSKIDEAKIKLSEAHKAQTELLQSDANMKPNLLLVHAQDHLMTSILIKDIVSGLVG